jgi:hypothetical protein
MPGGFLVFGDKLNEATFLEFGKRTAGVSRVGLPEPGARQLPPPQMFHEYPNDVALNRRGFVKQVGRNSFNGVSQRQKLPLPRDVFRTLHARQFVHRGVTDLTLNRFAVVQHRKPECQPLGVVSYNLASGQRHQSTPLIVSMPMLLFPWNAGVQPECMHKFPLFLPLSRPNQALGCCDRPFDWELRGV